MGHLKKIYVLLFISTTASEQCYPSVRCTQRKHWFEACFIVVEKKINTFCRHLFKGRYKGGNVASNHNAPPLLLCLFTFWQSLSLFCYFLPSNFISTYTFLWRLFSGFRGCLLVVMQPLSSLLQQSFAMPFHPLPLILPSTVWAFEIRVRLLFNTFQNVHKTLPLVCRAAWKEVNKNDSENRTVTGC